MKPRHSAGNSAARPALIPQAHGGKLLAGGLPGNQGGGRLPDEFKAAMAALASSDEVLEALRSILRDPNHPSFVRALDYATERGFGAVSRAATIEISQDLDALYLQALMAPRPLKAITEPAPVEGADPETQHPARNAVRPHDTEPRP